MLLFSIKSLLKNASDHKSQVLPLFVCHCHMKWVTDALVPAGARQQAAQSFTNSPHHGQNGLHLADDIFECIFLNENFCILIQISLKFVQRFKWQKASIGSDNGLSPICLALNRRQAIIWSKADWIHWCIYAAPGGDELRGSGGHLLWPYLYSDSDQTEFIHKSLSCH